VNACNFRSELVGLAIQAEAEQQVDAHEQECTHRSDDPQRQRADPLRARLGHAFPVRRERALEFVLLLAQQLIEAILERVELRPAAVDDTVTTLEPELQTDVDEFEQILVFAGVACELREQLKHLLAAPGVVVKLDQQALLDPHAGSPRRACDHLVEHGAQDVARRDDVLGGQIGVACFGLEIAHRARQIAAQLLGVGMLERAAQRRIRLSSGLANATSRFKPLAAESTSSTSVDSGPKVGAWRRHACARRRQDHGAIAAERHEGIVLTHAAVLLCRFHRGRIQRPSAQFLMAHSSISRPGNPLSFATRIGETCRSARAVSRDLRCGRARSK
jgi:hypothetical protein